jgi:ATP-dependent DNA helicase RecG
MNVQALLSALSLGEEKDWEFKSAKGGLPGSLWETYSAMANTDGGCIILGVEQEEDRFRVSGLSNPAQIKKSFWDTANNRGKISINLLRDNDVFLMEVEEKIVLVVRVPRATRRDRPVFVGQNPLQGTYRRNYEGDYHCSSDEVGRMLADRAEEPADSLILNDFTFDDLDSASLQQYRQRFSARSPAHPWLAEDVVGLLTKLGGWRKDRQTKVEGLTLAGLLMFGRDEAIRDAAALPGFHLDYRERLSEDPNIRWTNRLTLDGTWTGNLFQFYQRVIQPLTADIKIPFQLQPDLFRKDDTIVHEAVREALVNALIHADYRGVGGIVIDKYKSRIILTNPGTLLISLEQLIGGGISECRNKSLQLMFLMIGGGEKAGSGIDKIRRGWESQKWRSPAVFETVQPDRVVFMLSMLSLMPDESLDRLHRIFGDRLNALNPVELQALVTADLEKGVSNARMRIISEEHPADLSRMLQGLVAKGFLEQIGQKRGTAYRLYTSNPPKSEDSPHTDSNSSPHTDSNSSPHNGDLPHSLDGLSEVDSARLREFAMPAVASRRLRPEESRYIILQLCTDIFLTSAQIARFMNRSPKGIQERFLAPMVKEGMLTLKYPLERTRPDQAYMAAREPKSLLP